MAFPPISVRQPRPHDLVDDPVRVCGVGTGFEGVISARVRDRKGKELREVGGIKAGGTGIWGNFEAEIDLPGVPETARGTLEVFQKAEDDSGRELHKVVVPLVFGKALIRPYNGFAQYTVKNGDTLSSVAEQFYGDADRSSRIFAANRNQLDDPDEIFPGQVLRVPQ